MRPQAGLDKADVVFEHIAEALLTRFTAIYLSQDADKVGSVRSARQIDLELPAMFRSILAFSGASAGNLRLLYSSDFADRIFEAGEGFVRIPQAGKALEHTLFTSTPALWTRATRRDINQRQELRGWVFTPEPPAGGEPASQLDVVYRAEIDHIARLEGGVYINLGSAVVLPEVFLKSLSAVRNMGYEALRFMTVNMDMQRHYRPSENVLRRPAITGAQAVHITGQHEIMLPLLAAAIQVEQGRLS